MAGATVLDADEDVFFGFRQDGAPCFTKNSGTWRTQDPFGLSLSKPVLSLSKWPCVHSDMPFDKLRANGVRGVRLTNIRTQPPFGLSLSKPCVHSDTPYINRT